MTERLLAPRDAGRRLGLTTSRIIQLAREGILRELRDSAGRRFFEPEEVERVAAMRAQQVKARRARERRRATRGGNDAA